MRGDVGRAARDLVARRRGWLARRPCTQIATAPISGMSEERRKHPVLVADGRQKGVHEFRYRKRLSNAEGAEHREHADDEHPGVGAELPGLELRPDPADEARELRAAVHAESVDQPVVDAAPEQPARHRRRPASRSRRRRSRRRSTCRASTFSKPSSCGDCAFGTSVSGLSRVHASAIPADRDEHRERRPGRTRVPATAAGAPPMTRCVASPTTGSSQCSSRPTGPRKLANSGRFSQPPTTRRARRARRADRS